MKNKGSRSSRMPNNVRYIKRNFKNRIRNILRKELSMFRKNIQSMRRKNILHRSRLRQKRANMWKKCNRNQKFNNMNQKKASTSKKGKKRRTRTRRKG